LCADLPFRRARLMTDADSNPIHPTESVRWSGSGRLARRLSLKRPMTKAERGIHETGDRNHQAIAA
jgi:hypothetical protein